MRSRGYTDKFPQATTAAEFPAAVHDALALDALLGPEERDIRKRVRAFMVRAGAIAGAASLAARWLIRTAAAALCGLVVRYLQHTRTDAGWAIQQ